MYDIIFVAVNSSQNLPLPVVVESAVVIFVALVPVVNVDVSDVLSPVALVTVSVDVVHLSAVVISLTVEGGVHGEEVYVVSEVVVCEVEVAWKVLSEVLAPLFMAVVSVSAVFMVVVCEVEVSGTVVPTDKVEEMP